MLRMVQMSPSVLLISKTCSLLEEFLHFSSEWKLVLIVLLKGREGKDFCTSRYLLPCLDLLSTEL